MPSRLLNQLAMDRRYFPTLGAKAALRALVVWRQNQILTLRKVFLLICSVLVAVPLVLSWAWPHAVSVLAIGLLLAALIALRLSLIIVHPIRDMIRVVRRRQSGDKSALMTVSGAHVPSEIRALQEAFNVMAANNDEARRRESEARQAAENESRAKSDFLRFVTHELRSPTNAIIGFGELLASERHGPLGAPSYREHVRDIVSGSRHLLSLINDLLDLSKIEAGQYALVLEPIGIDELIERCCRYLRPCVLERQIAIQSYYPGVIPALMVDERAMFQALLNLATNAVRYGFDRGNVIMTARLLDDGSAEILVEDDGPGIAATDLLRVMEPFQRVDNPNSRHIQGTGLGLPIVKRLIELHGGTFTLESESGRGTRARIQLPATSVVPELPVSPVPLLAVPVPVREAALSAVA
jgi:signal transduction histidine kinase